MKSLGKYLPVRCIFWNVFDSSNGRSNKFNELYRKSRYFKFTTLPKTDGLSSDRFVHVMFTVCRMDDIFSISQLDSNLPPNYSFAGSFLGILLDYHTRFGEDLSD